MLPHSLKNKGRWCKGMGQLSDVMTTDTKPWHKTLKRTQSIEKNMNKITQIRRKVNYNKRNNYYRLKQHLKGILFQISSSCFSFIEFTHPIEIRSSLPFLATAWAFLKSLLSLSKVCLLSVRMILSPCDFCVAGAISALCMATAFVCPADPTWVVNASRFILLHPWTNGPFPYGIYQPLNFLQRTHILPCTADSAQSRHLFWWWANQTGLSTRAQCSVFVSHDRMITKHGHRK